MMTMTINLEHLEQPQAQVFQVVPGINGTWNTSGTVRFELKNRVISCGKAGFCSRLKQFLHDTQLRVFAHAFRKTQFTREKEPCVNRPFTWNTWNTLEFSTVLCRYFTLILSDSMLFQVVFQVPIFTVLTWNTWNTTWNRKGGVEHVSRNTI